MSSDSFDVKILTEKLSKLNNSQQSIESLSRWCISHRKKARQIVETWGKLFNSSQKEQCVSFLYLANDILQNSRRKGSEFVNEFWKVLPAALKHVYDNGDEAGKKAATRLVDIWEERKVFGSRVQSLKDEMVANPGKDPAPQVVSNGKSANPIKIVKKDAQSLRIKLSVGGFPEKILSALHCLHEECSKEEFAESQCNAAFLSVERIVKEVENTISQGNMPGSEIADELQEHENVLQQCVEQLEGAEETRVALVSLLNEALQDQEAKLETLRSHLQVARNRINQVEIVKPKILSYKHGGSTTPVSTLNEQPKMGEIITPNIPVMNNLQIPMNQIPHPTQPTTSFASLTTTDEESKKAAAAAVAAKLAASTSSAQMLTSILSSLVAEEAASMNGNSRNPPGFSSGLPGSLPEKRQKLENPSSGGADVTNSDMGGSSYFTPLRQPISGIGPPPPPPPPLAANQFVQSTGMMLNMMPPFGFGGNSLPPPPPPPPHLAMRPPTQQSPPPLQPPQQPGQHQNAGGGYYRPPGIGLYGSSSQPSTMHGSGSMREHI